jgi:tetratricopeptide (TPR) repeat protein
MSQRDAAGLAVTCAGPEALEAFNRILWAGVSYVEYLFPLAERAVELDEGLVLAHCLLVSAHKADSEFLLNNFQGYLQLSSFHPASSPQVSGHVNVAKTALEGGTLTEREERHVQALLAYAEGQLPTAIDHWAAILVNYPRDLLATHMLFVACKMLGMFARARDTLAALLPHWEKNEPLYPYLLAFYAFGLEETRYYREAEKAAREAIELQRKTPFAFHVMAHVIEETKEAGEGVEFLTGSRGDWSDTVYNNHLTWHLTLYRLGGCGSVSLS